MALMRITDSGIAAQLRHVPSGMNGWTRAAKPWASAQPVADSKPAEPHRHQNYISDSYLLARMFLFDITKG